MVTNISDYELYLKNQGIKKELITALLVAFTHGIKYNQNCLKIKDLSRDYKIEVKKLT